MVYGDLMLDSMLAEVRAVRFDPPLTDEELLAELEDWRPALAGSIPAGSKAIGELEEVPEGTAWYSFTVHELSNGLIIETAAVLTPSFGSRVGFIAWPQMRRGSNVGAAERAVRSISE